MALLLDLAGLLVLFSFADCEDAHLVTAEADGSPVVHMELYPRRKTLTWKSRRNVTEQECKIDTPPSSSTRQDPKVKGDGTYFCRFPNAVLHRGATLTVHGMVDGTPFQSVLEFRNPGLEGSGAVNFSCLIYNLHHMNCSWNPGPAAPADVQYHLYGWTSSHEDEVECSRYVPASGTHMGCRFDELVGSQLADSYFFVVNGTSKEAAIQFTDFDPLRGIQIEKVDPPANLTVGGNGSHHVIQWHNPRLRFEASSSIFFYELDIQREGTSSKQDSVFLRGSEENVYLMPSSSMRAGHTVRARVRFMRSELWSDWTPILRFGLPDQDVGGFPGALLGMVVGVAALAITVLMFLCTRFSLRRKLFPRVPQVKREVTGTGEAFPEVSVCRGSRTRGDRHGVRWAWRLAVAGTWYPEICTFWNVPQKWNQPGRCCPMDRVSTDEPGGPGFDERMRWPWPTHTVEYYAALNKVGLLPFETARRDLETMMLRDTSRSEKDSYPIISLLPGS
ncbi:granulocyte-macrophage colony-stimulating factor receptor subunit alpha-like [Myotis daubentonii]|uniref:granulocyte-macrophage colony-stimulating factor receptor subunit alpha-like n=1 Tax=Myotis daubentonii TaxID=98922 RepID=UPI00287313F5|nr:granulocyte-macrophage colony-stimulating factor receptor subunit alpha-like [Myotis daubentonii]